MSDILIKNIHKTGFTLLSLKNMHLYTTFAIFDADKDHIYIEISPCKNSPLQMFYKTRVLKNLANFTGKQLRWSLILVSLFGVSFQLFSSEICRIFKNIFIHRTPLVSASAYGIFTRRSFRIKWKMRIIRAIVKRCFMESYLISWFFPTSSKHKIH